MEERRMDLGIMFFASTNQASEDNKYRLVIEASRFADEHGLACVWTPERHFHAWGGSFPNPAVLSSALAMITKNVQIRAGSVIAPLHDTVRIAEEWSIVDNLSHGRIGISFGAGWNVNDFIFYPDRYDQRHAVMYQQIETVSKLWSGGTISAVNSQGTAIEVGLYPKPIQKTLPIWISCSGSTESFVSAGKIGANLLTHLLYQNLNELTEKVRLYREARERNGFDPDGGTVTLMLHTFLAEDYDTAIATVREPFLDYLRTYVNLEQDLIKQGSGAGDTGGRRNRKVEALLEMRYQNYLQNASLIGTVASCSNMLSRVRATGVNEIACLIDFIDDEEAILSNLRHIAALRESAFAAV
jgi:natural product biosynthesis luciferase-like monooxygenase protein